MSFDIKFFQARLQKGLLNREACLTIQHAFFEAVPGKCFIKRHSPSILYIYGTNTDFLSITYRTLDKRAYQKIIFLFLNQNICCGYSKEPSQ